MKLLSSWEVAWQIFSIRDGVGGLKATGSVCVETVDDSAM